MTDQVRGNAPASAARPQGVRSGVHSADAILDAYNEIKSAESAPERAEAQKVWDAQVAKRSAELRLRYGARAAVIDALCRAAADKVIELDEHMAGEPSAVGRDTFAGVYMRVLDNVFRRAAEAQLNSEAREAS